MQNPLQLILDRSISLGYSLSNQEALFIDSLQFLDFLSAHQWTTSDLIVEELTIGLVLLDVVECREAPVLGIGLELEDNVLVFRHIDVEVVQAVHSIDHAGHLDRPLWSGEVTNDYDVAVVVR